MNTEMLFLALLIVIVLVGSITDGRIKRTTRNVARLERKIDLILGQLGIQEADPELDRVNTLLRDGKKIPAIKLYREITGADLVEAKNAVERMESQI
ncbi:ribosomal protein L7/L12 [Streptomyces spiramyceticus]|uniref:ribosomal protein L7/L12 n=1 Tax=Streptomyces spiramyceticus TaxID=299717 RepID=UPI00237A1244|nr:ribosomal protein L7/L12 [Streptomyces spiramyceticus]